MLLDRSGSMKQNFELEERAAEAFVHAMLPGDKARLGSFAKYIQIDPEDFTADRDALIKILRTELQDDGPTPLWNAVDRGVDKLVRSYLVNPAMHAVAAAASQVDTMDHLVFAVAHAAKVEVATEIAGRPARTLFFVRTKHGADRLAEQFGRAGVPANAIHGNLTQNARKRALESFSGGHQRVLVATDVAARGIHVDDVDLVVHFDPPADHKDYLHRSGRTARAGARGTVLSLLTSDQVRDNQRMRERAGVEVSAQSVVPGHPAVVELANSGEPVVVSERPLRAARPERPPYRGGSRPGYQGSRPSQGRPAPRRTPAQHS